RLGELGRLAIAEKRSLAAVLQRARRLVDAESELLLVGALVEDEGIAPDIGREVAAGAPVAAAVDEEVGALAQAQDAERRRLRRRGEDDRVVPGRRLELAAVQEHGVAAAGEAVADALAQRLSRVAAWIDRRQRAVENGKARLGAVGHGG